MALLRLDPLLNIFLTAPCPLCDRPGKPLLCHDCQQQLQDCQASSQSAQSIQLGQAQPPLTRLGIYEGPTKRAIAQLKYNNTPALAQPLGEGLAEVWLQQQPNKHYLSRFKSSQHPWVLPVPMHPTKQRQRGFNQAELIAQNFCHRSGLPLMANGLHRIQATQPQFELSPAERQQNVSQAFAIGAALQQKRHQRRPVLLLDDIYTTGATIQAIAQVLTAAQIPIAGIVVVAQAMK